MAKRWFASSGRGRGDEGKRRARLAFLLAAFALGFAPTGVARAGTSPDALDLPAFDLGAINPKPSPEVGDRLDFEIQNAPAGAAKVEPIPEPSPAAGAAPDPLQDIAIVKSEGAKLEAVPLKPGTVTLPGLLIEDQDGKRIGRTNPLTLNVASAIPDNDPKPNQPVPPEPPVNLRLPIVTVSLIGIGILAAFAAIILLLIQLARRVKPVEAAKPALPKPEDVTALEELGKLQARALVAKGQFKPHYFGISDILKAYLGARYGFDALECTSAEMILALEERKAVGATLLDQVESIFARLDRVKFTDHVPNPADGEALIEEARRVVQLTRRPPLAPQ